MTRTAMVLLVLAACHPPDPDPVCVDAIERARLIEQKVQANEDQLLQLESMARDIASKLPETAKAESRCPPPISCALDPQCQYNKESLDYLRNKVDRFKEKWTHGDYMTSEDIFDALNEL